MKRRLVTALCSALAVATALPAFALDNQFAGLLRVRGIMANNLNANEKNNDPDKLVTQRFRLRYTGVVNEYLQVVYFSEVDMEWGDADYKTMRNDGGGIGGDSVNWETKNIYMVVKVPDTSVTATIGLQGVSDNWDRTYWANDGAGVKLAFKDLFGAMDANLAWYKWSEGDRALPNGRFADSPGFSNGENDTDVYFLQAAFKPMGALKLGADFYYLRNLVPDPAGASANVGFNSIGTREDLYNLGVNAAFKVSPLLNLSGWAMYQFGTEKDVKLTTTKTDDVSISAFAGSAKADLTGQGWGGFVRGIYFSSDSNVTNKTQNYVRNPLAAGGSEHLPFGFDGLAILWPDGNNITYPGNQSLAAKAAWGPYGLWGFTAGASFSPTAIANSYVRAAVGYYAALKKDPKGATKMEGTDLGTEVGLRVGYKMAKNLDLSIGGNYLFIGKFFDKKAKDFDKPSNTTADPDDPYLTYVMANLDF